MKTRLLGRLLCYALLAGGLAGGGCVESFTPDGPATSPSYLVVDGFINPLGSSVVKLSRTTALATTAAAPAETRATVLITDERGTSYGTLSEGVAGTYTSPALSLDPSRSYRLRITTAKNRVYLSDPSPTRLTPALDRVGWELTPDGVQVLVDTHDATNATRYYRWEFTETWEFVAAYHAALQFVDSKAAPQVPYVVPLLTDNMYHCWRTEQSTAIYQRSTARLTQDVVSRYPLQLLKVPNQRFLAKYSILVRQYGQTQAEYDYWDQLRSNTERLGTLNDPLPVQLTGNVHAQVDPDEVVLGFVGVHSVTEQRLFIDRAQLPTGRLVYADEVNDKCQLQTIPHDLYQMDQPPVYNYDLEIFRRGELFPVENIGTPANPIYSASTRECIDCRLRGTSVKPSFWP